MNRKHFVADALADGLPLLCVFVGDGEVAGLDAAAVVGAVLEREGDGTADVAAAVGEAATEA
jgi:hypothetical protein